MVVFLKEAARWLDRGVAVVVILLLIAMTAVTSAGVFSRYVLNDALSWSEELGSYLLVWVSFLGAALAAYRGAHIGVGILFDRLPTRVQRWLGLVVDALVLVFLAAVLVSSLEILPVVRMRVSATLFVTMDIPYLVLPLSTGIILFQVLVRMLPEGKNGAAGP